MEGMGEEKLYSPILQLVKRKKPSSGRSISTHFVADCSFLAFAPTSSVVEHLDSGMATTLLFFYIIVNQPLMRRFQQKILLNSEDAIEASRAN